MRLPVSSGWGIVLFLSLMVEPLLGGPIEEEVEADRIAALIDQLGDETYASREAASRDLTAMGEVALPMLRHAEGAGKDPEIRLRARGIIRAILLGLRESPSTALKLELIVPGGFVMGSPRRESGRRPDEAEHVVRITRPFLMGKFEVTQDEFQQVMEATPSWFTRTGGGQEDVDGVNTSRFPVENVSWFDALEFCNRLSMRDG